MPTTNPQWPPLLWPKMVELAAKAAGFSSAGADRNWVWTSGPSPSPTSKFGLLVFPPCPLQTKGSDAVAYQVLNPEADTLDAFNLAMAIGVRVGPYLSGIGVWGQRQGVSAWGSADTLEKAARQVITLYAASLFPQEFKRVLDLEPGVELPVYFPD